MQNAENILFTVTMIGYFGAMILYFLFVAIRKENLAKAAGILTAHSGGTAGMEPVSAIRRMSSSVTKCRCASTLRWSLLPVIFSASSMQPSIKCVAPPPSE